MRQEIPRSPTKPSRLKAVAREAGQRSKVAVVSRNTNVDPIGACIGHRGRASRRCTGELQRERVDIILWDPESARVSSATRSHPPSRHIDVKQRERARRGSTSATISSLCDRQGRAERPAGRQTDGLSRSTWCVRSTSPISTPRCRLSPRALGRADPGNDDAKRAAFEALFSAAPEAPTDVATDRRHHCEAGAETAPRRTPSPSGCELTMSARGHVPLRRCGGCRRSRPQAELLRFAQDEAGVWQLDPARRAGGRGSWVCRDTPRAGRPNGSDAPSGDRRSTSAPCCASFMSAPPNPVTNPTIMN
jgi:hypothetical protein